MKSDFIKDIKVPLKVVIGEAEASIGELASLGEGSIIELNRIAGEPIDLYAAGEIIAKCEVVVIDERYGIRVTEVIQDKV